MRGASALLNACTRRHPPPEPALPPKAGYRRPGIPQGPRWRSPSSRLWQLKLPVPDEGRAFARGVNRADVTQGAEELGVDLDGDIAFWIEAMRRAGELGLKNPQQLCCLRWSN